MQPSKKKTPYQYFIIGKLTPTDTKLHLYRSDSPSCRQPYYIITSLLTIRHTTLIVRAKINILGQLPQAWNKPRECLLPMMIKLDPLMIPLSLLPHYKFPWQWFPINKRRCSLQGPEICTKAHTLESKFILTILVLQVIDLCLQVQCLFL